MPLVEGSAPPILSVFGFLTRENEQYFWQRPRLLDHHLIIFFHMFIALERRWISKNGFQMCTHRIHTILANFFSIWNDIQVLKTSSRLLPRLFCPEEEERRLPFQWNISSIDQDTESKCLNEKNQEHSSIYRFHSFLDVNVLTSHSQSMKTSLKHTAYVTIKFLQMKEKHLIVKSDIMIMMRTSTGHFDLIVILTIDWWRRRGWWSSVVAVLISINNTWCFHVNQWHWCSTFLL